MAHDHEADRELIQQTLSQEWGEPACAVCILHFIPEFSVPGRRHDGSLASQHRVRRFCRLVVNTVWTVAVLAIELFAAFFASSSPGLDFPGKSYAGAVRGPEGSSAVQFADAVRRGSFWLVFGASHLAAAKIASSPPVTVAWSAVGSDRPQLGWEDEAGQKLQWPDGSTVTFFLGSGERQRLVAL